MGRGARWALLVGVALIAIAARGDARAEVRPINLDGCSGSCFTPTADDPAAAEDDVTLSLFGGGDADDPGADLILDPKATPTVLVGGLPSPLASADVDNPGAGGPSPYDFFEDVISLPAEARAGFAKAALFLFTPSLIGRLTVIDVLATSNALFNRRPPRRAW